MRRRPFTLLEVLLVIALVALCGGVGIKVTSAFRHQRFCIAVAIVESKVQLAKELALYREEPISLTLSPHRITVDQWTTKIKGVDSITPEKLIFYRKASQGTITIRGAGQTQTLSLSPTIHVRRP